MLCRGVRGATIVENNTEESILAASRELLQNIIEANNIDANMVACAIFTTTSDLNAGFPAAAARQLGWSNAALLGARESDVPGSLQMCLRILILFNTDKQVSDIKHVYLKGTKVLRKELPPIIQIN